MSLGFLICAPLRTSQAWPLLAPRDVLVSLLAHGFFDCPLFLLPPLPPASLQPLPACSSSPLVAPSGLPVLRSYHWAFLFFTSSPGTDPAWASYPGPPSQARIACSVPRTLVEDTGGSVQPPPLPSWPGTLGESLFPSQGFFLQPPSAPAILGFQWP